MATVTRKETDDMLIIYDSEKGWYIEGNTPMGWVCFELAPRDTKTYLAVQLFKCGLTLDEATKLLEDF